MRLLFSAGQAAQRVEGLQSDEAELQKAVDDAILSDSPGCGTW
jgi:hypothetical protein